MHLAQVCAGILAKSLCSFPSCILAKVCYNEARTKGKAPRCRVKGEKTMKYKTTRKAIVNAGGQIRYAGYCELGDLLRYHAPTAYTAGVYGWNFDV